MGKSNADLYKFGPQQMESRVFGLVRNGKETPGTVQSACSNLDLKEKIVPSVLGLIKKMRRRWNLPKMNENSEENKTFGLRSYSV